MSLVGIKILGIDIEDKLLYKLLLGIISVILLIALIGFNGFSNWVMKSLVVWIGAMFLFVSFAYYFIEEEFTLKQVFLIIIGLVIIFVYGYFQGIPWNEVAASVIQSLVWMTIFSILLDPFKRFIEK
jgi:hypothetical protein